jgi:hypothetical protein
LSQGNELCDDVIVRDGGSGALEGFHGCGVPAVAGVETAEQAGSVE